MSYTGKYVSLKTAVERVYNRFHINYDFTYNDAAEWVGNMLANIQASNLLEEKIACATISDNRGSLPCDLESITQVAKIEGCNPPDCTLAAFSVFGEGNWVAPVKDVDTLTRTFEYCCKENSVNIDLANVKLIPMRWSTDNFHYKFHNNPHDWRVQSDYTYKLNRGYIFPNFKEGKVLISYKGIPLDEEGYPMIPAEEWWINACAFEIAYTATYKAYMADRVSEKIFNLMYDDRNWYLAQAVNKSKLFTNDDDAQSFVNQMTSLIPRGTGHENFFRNISREQQIYNQPVRRW